MLLNHTYCIKSGAGYDRGGKGGWLNLDQDVDSKKNCRERVYALIKNRGNRTLLKKSA